MSVEELLGRLKDVRQTGPNQWQARCPAHDDRKPSLSIKVDSGQILLYCHAGCNTTEILHVLGLTEADLFLKDNGKRIAATYDYRDANGELLYQVVRFEPKGFAQRRPNGNGKWVWSLRGVNRVLYRLPELLAADPDKPVFVVEGEKDADRLASLGLVATTNPGGAGKWREEYTETLKGRHVVILADNDDPGREHARKVAESLKEGTVSVKIVELPNLPPKGDVSDWLAQGGTKDKLLKLVKEAPEYAPEPKGLGRLVQWSEVEPEEVEWLWYPRIPLGKLTLIAGDPGAGKTTAVLDLVARITRGAPMPDGAPSEVGKVLFFTYEDGLADTLVPRAHAAGADLEHIITYANPPTVADLPALEAAIAWEAQTEQALKAVILDPVQAFLGPAIDMSKANEVRSVLAALNRIAETYRVAIILVGHLRKSSGGRSLYRPLGSVDFVAGPRSVLLIAREDAEEHSPQARRVLIPLKSSLAPEGDPLAFRIVGDGSARVEWLGTVNVTAADLLEPSEEGGALQEAKGFLIATLAEGELPATKIYREAKANGISERTLRRAKKQLNVHSVRTSQGWVWSLPPAVTTTAEGRWPAPGGDVGHLGRLKEKIDSNSISPWPCSLATFGHVGKVAKAAKIATPGHVGHLGPSTSTTDDSDDPSTWPTCRGCERKVPEVNGDGLCPDCVAVGGSA